MNPDDSSRVRLDSWKTIAGHLGRSVRTVQRWELEEKLPVHRLQLQQRGAVFAHRDELDEWWQSRSQRLSAQPAEPESAAPHRRYRVWFAAGVAGVALAALLVTRTAATRRDPEHQIAVPLTTYERGENGPTFSPDGSEFACN